MRPRFQKILLASANVAIVLAEKELLFNTVEEVSLVPATTWACDRHQF